LRRGGDITPDEWGSFLRGSTTDFSENKNELDYMNEETWHKVLGLEEANFAFKDIS